MLPGNRRSGPDGCRPKMILNANFVSPHRSPRNGFSLVELVLSLAVLLIITTLAIPVVVRSLQTYQLPTASQLAGMLKFTKFDAIRQNTHVNFQIAQHGTNWVVWADSNGDGVADGAEPQMVLPITGTTRYCRKARAESKSYCDYFGWQAEPRCRGRFCRGPTPASCLTSGESSYPVQAGLLFRLSTHFTWAIPTIRTPVTAR